MRKSYAGAAPRTTLASPISDTDASLTVGSGAGAHYPDGSDGPFVLTIARNTSNEEKVLCSSRTVDTFTIQERGWDGTIPSSHGADIPVEHTLDADSLTEFTLAMVPVGGIIMWTGALVDLPDNWKLCDGTNGTPDLRNRFLVGAGDIYDIGDTGGEASVTLGVNHLPSHSHGAGTLGADSAGAHTHGSGTLDTNSTGAHTHGSGTLDTNSTGSHGHTSGTLSTGNSTHRHNFTMVRSDAGVGSQTHGHQHSGWPGAMLTHGSGVFTTNASNDPVQNHTHSHGVSGTVASNGSHSHNVSGSTASNGSHSHSVSGSTASGGAHTHDVSGSTASTGDGEAHENRPPYYAVAYIMRAA